MQQQWSLWKGAFRKLPPELHHWTLRSAITPKGAHRQAPKPTPGMTTNSSNDNIWSIPIPEGGVNLARTPLASSVSVDGCPRDVATAGGEPMKVHVSLGQGRPLGLKEAASWRDTGMRSTSSQTSTMKPLDTKRQTVLKVLSRRYVRCWSSYYCEADCVVLFISDP
jgi:hypothetical protein